MAQKVYLIIGAGGQLGGDLMEVFGNSAVGLTHADLDVTDEDAIIAAVERIKPAVVINTVAFHRSEECEKDPAKSFEVNALGAWNVARAAFVAGAVSVYVSTDYVFGNAKNEYAESDIPDPLNVYGTSKFAGEKLTAIANPRHYVIRTSALFGRHKSGKGHNFVTLMLSLAAQGHSVRVVNDQYTAPTYAKDLALKMRELINANAPYGIYHMANVGGVSWYGFAEEIFRAAGVQAALEGIPASSRPSEFVRPDSTVLISESIVRAGMVPMRSWQAALAEYLTFITK